MQEKLENVHDIWIDKLFEEYKQFVKEKVIESFI